MYSFGSGSPRCSHGLGSGEEMYPRGYAEEGSLLDSDYLALALVESLIDSLVPGHCLAEVSFLGRSILHFSSSCSGVGTAEVAAAIIQQTIRAGGPLEEKFAQLKPVSSHEPCLQ